MNTLSCGIRISEFWVSHIGGEFWGVGMWVELRRMGLLGEDSAILPGSFRLP